MVLWVLGGIGLQQPSAAKAPDPVDQAFQRMMDNPGDIDLIYAFGSAAAKDGDYEGAIAAFEQMLLIDPNLPRIQAELGILYFRLKSFETAKTYFLRAKQSPGLPGPVSKRIETFLAQIETATSVHRLDGAASIGLRYQTNANSAPNGGDVLVSGFAFELDEGSRRADDVNTFLSGQARYQYDLGTQSGDVIEVNANLFASRYASLKDIDVLYGALDIGLWSSLVFGEETRVSFRPALLAEYFLLGDTSFRKAVGGQLAVNVPISDSLALYSLGAFRLVDYDNSTTRPTTTGKNGEELHVSGTLTQQISPTFSVGAALQAQRVTAVDADEAYDQ